MAGRDGHAGGVETAVRRGAGVLLVARARAERFRGAGGADDNSAGAVVGRAVAARAAATSN